jgi:alpha-L-fucosidase
MKIIKLMICAFIVTFVFFPEMINAQKKYKPTWESVNEHNSCPEWFKDAKFGIYWYWGPYLSASYEDNDWYGRYMYVRRNKTYSYHDSVFGNPANWEYHKFIEGAYDKNNNHVKFNPRLKSAGGNFDPEEWIQLCADAGAKYVGPTVIFHDGFSMYHSAVNPWNSFDKGPQLDILELFKKAILARNLKLFTGFNNAYNVASRPGSNDRYFYYAPAHTDPGLKKLYGQMTDDEEQNYFYECLKEVIDNYQPDIMFHDFNLDAISDSIKLKYLAHYYNQARKENKEVVVTAKDGVQFDGIMYNYERGGADRIRFPYWQTDDASGEKWMYAPGMKYFSVKAEIATLVDRVSKNGNLLLCISPMADGSIPQAQKGILLGMGAWLKKFGEAIYNTRAWESYGEGPTKIGGGQLEVRPTEGTESDFRFTRDKTSTKLYVIGMSWPKQNLAIITKLRKGIFDTSKITDIEFVGGKSLAWKQDTEGLKIELPLTPTHIDSIAYAVKIICKESIPLSRELPRLK